MDKRVEAAAKFLFAHAGYNWDTTSELARDGFRLHAREILTAADAAAPQAGGAVPAGYKLVPVEPDIGMLQAALEDSRYGETRYGVRGSAVAALPHCYEMAAARQVWSAMLAATPPDQARPANSAVRDEREAFEAAKEAWLKVVNDPEAHIGRTMAQTNAVALESAVRAALASLGAGGWGMSEKPESLNTQLANAVAAVARAQDLLRLMSQAAARARNDETDAFNKVNEAQRHFDSLVAQVKTSAPRDTDWKRAALAAQRQEGGGTGCDAGGGGGSDCGGGRGSDV